jgi:hypothetical protein
MACVMSGLVHGTPSQANKLGLDHGPYRNFSMEKRRRAMQGVFTVKVAPRLGVGGVELQVGPRNPLGDVVPQVVLQREVQHDRVSLLAHEPCAPPDATTPETNGLRQYHL